MKEIQEPMTRETAKLLNLRNYVPLEPCRHGHIYLRSTKYGHCLACKNLKNSGVKLRPVEIETPMSREQAQILGLTRYKPTEPCKYGHDSFRSTKYGHCLRCASLRARGAAPVPLPPRPHLRVEYASPEAKQAIEAYASQWLEYDRKTK